MKQLSNIFALLIFSLFLIISSSPFIFGQDISALSQEEIARNELQSRNEVHFKFTPTPEIDLQILSRNLSIDQCDHRNHRHSESVYAYANAREFEQFLSYKIDFEVIEHLPTSGMTVATTAEQMIEWDQYPSYNLFLETMAQFSLDYPDLCKIENIGATNEGRQLLVAKLSDNVNENEDEPEFLYLGPMHGDETAGYVLTLRLMDYLLSNYETDEQASNILNNMELWIAPLCNPDGTYNGGDGDVSNPTRSNAQGFDLNRNYPSITDGPHPDGNPYAPETIHFMEFAEEHDFVMSVNTHGGAEVVNFPWDHWTSNVKTHADDNWWQYVSLIYANNAQSDAASTGDNNYMTDVTSNGITEGGDWYVVSGSRQDWMNYFRNSRETTLELSSIKTLPGAQLPNNWITNKQAMLDYIEEALYGIRGVITDACSGESIVAKVEIIGHDEDNSQVYSSLPIGNYHRPIFEGSYDLTFSAPGYQSQTIENISITNGNTLVQNISLNPDSPLASFDTEDQLSCGGMVEFEALSAAVDTWEWDFGDGNTSTEAHPVHLYEADGNYTVSLTVTNCAGSNTSTETNFISINGQSLPDADFAAICEPGAVELSANGAGTLEWYEAATGGDPIHTGSTFTTPVINNSTSYYVANVFSTSSTYSIGSTNSSNNGNYHNGGFYQQFSVASPILLKSVEINAETVGNVTVELLFNDEIANTATVAVPAGVSRIDLNFTVPAGDNFGLRLGSAINLWRNNEGVNYPYEIADVLSVYSSTAGSDYYYYFYDWEVTQDYYCSSDRIEVVAQINPESSAEFSFNYIDNEDELSVSFSNLSVDANSYFWDFGDGNTSEEANPTHTFENGGFYEVTLIASNDCNADTIVNTVSLDAVGLSNIEDQMGLNIYPNPSTGWIQIRFEKALPTAQITVRNILGSIVLKQNLLSLSQHSLDLSKLPDGLYLIQIEAAGQISSKKVILNR